MQSLSSQPLHFDWLLQASKLFLHLRHCFFLFKVLESHSDSDPESTWSDIYAAAEVIATADLADGEIKSF